MSVSLRCLSSAFLHVSGQIPIQCHRALWLVHLFLLFLIKKKITHTLPPQFSAVFVCLSRGLLTLSWNLPLSFAVHLYLVLLSVDLRFMTVARCCQRSFSRSQVDRKGREN